MFEKELAMNKFVPALIFILLLSSCNLPATSPTATTTSPIVNTTTTQPASIEIVEPLSLDSIPLIWFAPLPPLAIVEGRKFTGSDDFMNLFKPDALWQNAAEHIHVFKLYGEWVGYASESQLKQAVQDAQRRGFALAMEFGPLDAEDCGQGIEGFSGVSYAVSAARRIKSAGGTLYLLAMDEPYFYAHFYDGPYACHWSAEKIAQKIDQFAQSMKVVFPDILIGDTEPLAGPAGAEEYKAWMQKFREVNGYDLAFLHMDIDWSRPGWADEVIAIEEYGDQVNVPVGIIYTGNAFDKTDDAWISAAGERVKKLEIEKNTVPDHILFQSWNDKPDRVLPETTDFTFTNFINDYFTDKSALGFPRQGLGANLALEKPVQVSNFTGDMAGALAVDGDLGTLWNSGGGPTQWIEIDLGAEYNIQEFRLTTSQYPEGATIHRILGRSVNGQFNVLTIFEGNTSEGQTLVYKPPQPVSAIQLIRVETISSPSWVAWRELEVIDAGK
jgi:hypothetical protein